MNEDNLIPGTMRSQSEARENGRKGGIASGRARRLKKQGKELLRELLSVRPNDPQISKDLAKFGINDKDLTGEVMMHLRQMDKAIRRADTKAYTAILKAAGIIDEQTGAATGTTINISVGSPEAAAGLQRALETGAQPEQPKNEQQ